MKASTKTFAILSLSAAIGKMLANTTKDERITYRGKKLYEAGLKATERYPFPQITSSKVRQIEAKISEVCKDGEDMPMVESLAFLLFGLIDLWENVSDKNRKLLDPVMTRVKWVQSLFDPKNEFEDIHVDALNKYTAWVA